MLIAQLSDLHLGEPGVTGPTGQDPGALLRRAVASLEAMDPRPDLVVLSGDLVERGSAAEYAHLAACLEGLSLPCYLMPGNHDDRDAMRRAFPQHGYLGREGFMQYAVDGGALRLLMLDSLIPGRPEGELCDARLAWLDERLCEEPGRPTLVFIHHPPLVTGSGHMDRSGLRNADGLGRVIAKHPQVERVAAGHVHRVMATRWNGTVLSTCPGLAYQFAVDLRAAGRNLPIDDGPAGTLYRWHEGTLISYIARLGGAGTAGEGR